MDIVLHPRAAPCDRLRVWLGAFQVTQAPALTWLFDGEAVEPIALRQIASARTDDLLPANQAPETVPRAFTGVYEFGGLQPDTLHTISVSSEDVRSELSVRTLPSEIPTELDTWFNVLLVSCHHAAEDRRGLSGIIASQLKALFKPHLTILAGDQVYLDLPTLTDFRDDERWLADKFERDYITNWRETDGYAQVLDCAPSVSIPDDHEYWNNFPHPSPFIQSAWSLGGRERWRKAAQAMYRAFQLPYPNNLLPFPTNLGEAFILDVAPLSFFIADTRSGKDPERRFTMPEEEHQQLNNWVDRVIAEKRLGIFVSGQSVFEDPISSIKGAIADYELHNYEDFGRIMQTLQRLAEAGLPLICLTGDVHWGRIATAQDITTGRTAITEIIASPSSLVTTVGSDTIKEIGGILAGLFGSADPWPRHAEPSKPPDFLASAVLGGRFTSNTIHGQKGNHVALLSFRQGGNSVRCRVSYWPIHSDTSVARPVESARLSSKAHSRCPTNLRDKNGSLSGSLRGGNQRMINILSSRAKAPSKNFKDPVPRGKGEDNMAWLGRNLPGGDVTHVVLVGGKSQTAFRLRLAQAHLRHDLVPSYWSHALLLKPAKNLAASGVIEISLEPEKGFAFPAPTNAVQMGKLRSYRDPSRFPNIAVLGIPIAQVEVMSALERFKMQRAVLDAVDLVVKWLAYAWGVSRSSNPLMDGQGIPSSAMLETVFGAAGFDLTPGLESRSSCPEAIWQAAKWWHEYYERDNHPRITGGFFTPDAIYDEPGDKKS